MKHLINGVVLSNELFMEYNKFSSGRKDYRKDIVKKILAFHFDGIVSNVKQYQDCGIEMPKDIESAMRQSGRIAQTLGELARDFTVFKIILTNAPNQHGYPFVNIASGNENISVSVTGCFKLKERRAKAVNHIAALCHGAKKIIIYDRFLDNSSRGVADRVEDALNKILPRSKVKIYYNKLSSRTLTYLTGECNDRVFEKCSFEEHHDRYIIVDNKIEIILSSGFDHLSFDNGKELTYIVRNITGESPRFQV